MINYANMLGQQAPQAQADMATAQPAPAPSYDNTGRPGSRRFQRAFQKLLAKQGKTLRKQPPGVDAARGAGQVKAAYLGGNKPPAPPRPNLAQPAYVNAMQYAARDRSREQGANQFQKGQPANMSRPGNYLATAMASVPKKKEAPSPLATAKPAPVPPKPNLQQTTTSPTYSNMLWRKG